MHDINFMRYELGDKLGKLLYGNFWRWVAYIKSLSVRLRKKHSENTFNFVVNMAKRARIDSISVNGKRFFAQSVLDKVRQDTVIVGPYAGSINVKWAYHLDGKPVHLPIDAAHGFAEAFRFIIAGARSRYRYIPKVFL